MTNEQAGTLVLKEQAGDYFLVPQEVLEQGRVPQEQKAELERLIAEQHDVQGHAVPVGIVVAELIGIGAMALIGSGAGDKVVKDVFQYGKDLHQSRGKGKQQV